MTETPIKSINLQGLLCPMPVIKVTRALREIQVGEMLEAYGTDPAIMADIPAWCRSTGNELITLEKTGEQYRFVVRRTK